MGIDLVEVSILAIASTIGAVSAAVILYVLSRALNLKRRAWISFAFLLLGSISGIAFLTSTLLPILTPTLMKIFPEPVYFGEAFKDPLLGRLLEDHPDLMDGLEARLIAAHFVGGDAQVRFEGERFGLQKSASLTADYFAKARGEDLVALMDLQGEVFGNLAKTDPDLCYPFLFGLAPDEVDLARRMDETIPINVEVLTERLIVNAHAAVPGFDQTYGERLIQKSQLRIALEFGEAGVALMSGEQRPRNQTEAKALCSIYEVFFTDIMASGPKAAETAWRSMFVSAGG